MTTYKKPRSKERGFFVRDGKSGFETPKASQLLELVLLFESLPFGVGW